MRRSTADPRRPRSARRRRGCAAAGRRLLLGLGAGLVAAALPAAPPRAGETLAGPVAAEVIDVLDGDTIAVRAHIWLGQEVVIRVRLDGIDAPELRAACREERRLAEAARDFLRREIADARVTLRRIRRGKYAGRVLAAVATADGRDIARMLLDRGLARPYRGGRRAGWCPS